MNKPRAIADMLRPGTLDRPRQSFFVLRETPCPYLDGRRERKLVTELAGSQAGQSYSDLSRGGFRRSHLFAYRPACRLCAACVPVRVAARDYRPDKAQRRLARRNADLDIALHRAEADHEGYRLFMRYLDARHPGGEMARMTFEDYCAMIEESAVDTELATFRGPGGRLVGACLLDWLDDGSSAVYSFFDPDITRRSPGSFMIHWLIEETARRGLDYVYLGYWIAGSRKMAYKARFHPLEGLGPRGWVRMMPEDTAPNAAGCETFLRV